MSRKGATFVGGNPAKMKQSWNDIKKALAGYDRAALISLISDLYASSAHNKSFFHARFSTGVDALKPYLKIIEDALYPDIITSAASRQPFTCLINCRVPDS
jgi:hypothetical protein